ncbi:MAG: hypothetical protein EA344_05755 [Alkalicoccus sp.]|uniref:Uncharacterized protein n=1 Tax=Alkalicoccus sp. TaxID=2005376 RepID=A0A651DID0_9BACI|nr:MAG: hypothetical protein EA344_05755 [Alkalicoccus sp.]
MEEGDWKIPQGVSTRKLKISSTASLPVGSEVCLQPSVNFNIALFKNVQERRGWYKIIRQELIRPGGMKNISLIAFIKGGSICKNEKILFFFAFLYIIFPIYCKMVIV